MNRLFDRVERLYTHAFTVNTETTAQAVMMEILAEDFESLTTHDRKDRATLIKQVGFFWQLVPDLRWTPQDHLEQGNKVVVRAIASGSPKGNFMGIECDGSKSFKIDSIDIHELRDGKVVRVRHLEDWASAMRQLKS